jgi:uncharacterized protein (UPF0248 family)
MQPIHKLLSRIRWDAEFASGDFALGYLDRIENRIVVVPLNEVRFPEDESNVFELIDGDGVTRRIPLHRVREVHKDGEVIWQRPSNDSG